MGGFAKVQVLGNLGRDPEVKFVGAQNTAVCELSVACTERVKKAGEWQDVTEWVRVVTFGKTAESAGQHLKKGRQVYADGRMQTREWEKDGVKHQRTEVVADRVIFLGGPGGAKSDAPSAPVSSPAPADDGIPF